MLHKRLLELGTVRYVLCQIRQKNDTFLETNRKVGLKLIARFSKCDLGIFGKFGIEIGTRKMFGRKKIVEKNPKTFSRKNFWDHKFSIFVRKIVR